MKIYAGGFARFFLGQWDGFDPETADDAVDADTEEAKPEDVRSYFESFKNQLANYLAETLPRPLQWSEAEDGPYKVVEVVEQEFGALLVIAARATVADKRMVPIAPHKDWWDDPAVVMLQDAENDFAPAHHLVKADTWLPADFSAVVETEVPERDVILGSLAQLDVALKHMDRILNTPNEVTRKLSTQFVSDARVAHKAFSELVAWALEHSMPILIQP